MSRLIASSSRLISSTCSCTILARLASTSAKTSVPSSSPGSSTVPQHGSMLPPPLPRHAHPNSLNPQPLAQSSTGDEPSALSLLASQPSHYISALLLGRRYLLTPNDILTVPKMKGVQPGDRIALSRILEVGSRDYTLRAASVGPTTSGTSAQLNANKTEHVLAPAMSRTVLRDGVPRDWQRHPDSLPYLASDVVQAELTVLEHTKGKMFEVEKFKRRKGYRRLLRSKLGFTKLRVGAIVLGNGFASRD